MPSFEDSGCPGSHGDLCISVTFPNLKRDMLVLSKVSENYSIYEGFLKEDNEISVLVIDITLTKKRMVITNS